MVVCDRLPPGHPRHLAPRWHALLGPIISAPAPSRPSPQGGRNGKTVNQSPRLCPGQLHTQAGSAGPPKWPRPPPGPSPSAGGPRAGGHQL